MSNRQMRLTTSLAGFDTLHHNDHQMRVDLFEWNAELSSKEKTLILSIDKLKYLESAPALPPPRNE